MTPEQIKAILKKQATINPDQKVKLIFSKEKLARDGGFVVTNFMLGFHEKTFYPVGLEFEDGSILGEGAGAMAEYFPIRHLSFKGFAASQTFRQPPSKQVLKDRTRAENKKTPSYTGRNKWFNNIEQFLLDIFFLK